jgi:hypothetical protein
MAAVEADGRYPRVRACSPREGRLELSQVVRRERLQEGSVRYSDATRSKFSITIFSGDPGSDLPNKMPPTSAPRRFQRAEAAQDIGRHSVDHIEEKLDRNRFAGDFPHVVRQAKTRPRF